MKAPPTGCESRPPIPRRKDYLAVSSFTPAASPCEARRNKAAATVEAPGVERHGD
jgi:hypothetical protein